MSQALVLVKPTPLAAFPSTDLLVVWTADLHLRGLSPSTIQHYTYDLAGLAKFLGRPLETATLEDLMEYGRASLVRQNAIATWARRVTAFRMFYEWLRRKQGRPSSVAQDLLPPRRPKRMHRFWTDAQVRQFRRAFRYGDPARLLTGRTRANGTQGHLLADPRVVTLRDRAICELGLMGLRVSEVIGLDLGDLIALRTERAAIVVHRKGGKDQVLPLARDACVALRRWLRLRPRVPTPYLFIRLPFQPARPARLHYQSVGRILRAYAERAGLSLPQGKMFHHLRHTAGQQMSELGMGIEEAQVFLGHENPATTMVYYEVSDKRLRRVAKRFRY